MGKAETVRRGRLGNKELRLVRKDGSFFGLIDGREIFKGEVAQDLLQSRRIATGEEPEDYGPTPEAEGQEPSGGRLRLGRMRGRPGGVVGERKRREIARKATESGWGA